MTPQGPPRRGMWRLLAGVLVALGLVLPLSSCTKGTPPVTEYHYALGDGLQNADCEGPCRAGAVALIVAALLWPLAACLAAGRYTGRRGTFIRLGIEPLLVGASGWWLYWQIFLSEPAIGFFAVSLGLALYSLVWLLEIVEAIQAARRARVR